MSEGSTSSSTPISVPASAVCLGCGYALRGLPEPRCPECGREFDAEDPSSWRDTAISRWRAFWTQGLWACAQQPRTWEILAICGLTILLLNVVYSTSLNERDGVSRLLAIESGTLLGTISILRLGFAWMALRRGPVKKRPTRLRRLRWVVMPICAVLLIVPWMLPIRYWSVEVRCARNRPALTAIAQETRSVGGARHLLVPGFGELRVARLGDARVKFDLGNAVLMYDPDGLCPDQVYEHLWLSPGWCYREIPFR